jgi:hypothetical protein
MWTEEEIRSIKVKVLPIVDPADYEIVDAILSDGNENWDGERIRERLFEAGFRVVKIDNQKKNIK